MTRLSVAALAMALLAGCVAAGPGSSTGSPGGSSSPAPAPPAVTPGPGSPGPSPADLPADPDTLVLQVRDEGGFIAPDHLFSQVPAVSVYADGRIIAPGAQMMIYPGPLLPAVLVTKVALSTVRELLIRAAEAGLTGGVNRSYPAHGVADVPDTVFVAWAAGRVTTTSFGALGMDQPVTDPVEQAARQAALAFQALLQGPILVGGTGSVPYVPRAVRLLVRTYAPDPAAPVQKTVAWPLPEPLASFGTAAAGTAAGTRCGVVSGSELATLWPVLEVTNVATGFASGAQTFQLTVRPLLPDETEGC